ncbi:MAG TPA: NAD(P)-dependent oxidoreductase [Solirubrobacteraceae bacterium]
MTQDANTRVGLLGAGRMGGPMGRHLLAAGTTLTVFDPSPQAREPLVALGAQPAERPSDVASASELVLVVVVDDEQVRDAVAGADGALEGARPGTTIAICASVRPDTCRRLAIAAHERDVDVVDAALVRGERGAEAGELVLYCGGPAPAVDRVRVACAPFAEAVVRVGNVGAGQVAKTANNILLWACLRADVEAQRLGRALGVEPRALREALALGSGANRPLAEWGAHRLRWPAKDLEVALAVAEEAGVDMPLVSQLPHLMRELSAEDLADLL